MIKILNSEQEEFGSLTSDNVYQTPLRFSGNGKEGFSVSKKIYIINDDNTKYYTNNTLKFISSNYDDIYGEWGETGFGIKALLGERRPTELEWDQTSSGEEIILPDIGTTDQSDTTNLVPIWIRFIVPGSTTAQLKSNIKIRIITQEKNLGT